MRPTLISIQIDSLSPPVRSALVSLQTSIRALYEGLQDEDAIRMFWQRIEGAAVANLEQFGETAQSA